MQEVLMKNARAAQTLNSAHAPASWLAVALEGFGRRKLVPAAGLLSIGDAASFIDPFTGSGMLMALESGELAATSIARHMPQLSDKTSYKILAADYRSRYDEQFNRRLRVCSALRRAAFVPRLAETTILVSSASDRLRRALARATRKG
jgi:flavin-dependent dehydrogenase